MMLENRRRGTDSTSLERHHKAQKMIKTTVEPSNDGRLSSPLRDEFMSTKPKLVWTIDSRDLELRHTQPLHNKPSIRGGLNKQRLSKPFAISTETNAKISAKERRSADHSGVYPDQKYKSFMVDLKGLYSMNLSKLTLTLPRNQADWQIYD